MAGPFDAFYENPAATIFGMAGLFFLAIWPAFHSRPAILAAQVSIGVFYALHYALLEAWTGAAVTMLGAAQALFALLPASERHRRLLALVFVPLPTIFAWATWMGMPSLLAAVALTLIMVGRMEADEYRMRLILLTAAPFNLAHDWIIGSVPAFAGDAIAALIGSVILVRLATASHRTVASMRVTAHLAERLHQPRPHLAGC